MEPSAKASTILPISAPTATRTTETKRDAFRRLAERRTNAVLDRIRVLSNLSNPYAYEYSEEDVRQIFQAIDQELKAARVKFQNVKKREFKLG